MKMKKYFILPSITRYSGVFEGAFMLFLLREP